MSARPTLPSAALAVLLALLPAPGCRAASEDEASTPVGTDGPLVALFLVVDGVYGTELTAPFDVLEHTRHHVGGPGGIEVLTVSPDGEPVRTAEGLTVVPDHSFADAPPGDILVVPSAEGSRDADLENRELVAWVAETGARARWVISLCWGGFVLGEAGLLDGRAATTFPADYQRFAARFDETELKVNVSFVHDGNVLTSQGGVRSFDVAMYLVDLLYGEDVARGVGAGLLIPWPPKAELQIYISDSRQQLGSARPAVAGADTPVR